MINLWLFHILNESYVTYISELWIYKSLEKKKKKTTQNP